MGDIRAPIFAVGTEDDHVAPLRSVYKLHLFADTNVTFVLTSGGHNAGIVSEPGHPGRQFRIADRVANATYRDPYEWLAETDVKDGSWGPALVAWFETQSGEAIAPPQMGTQSGPYKALCDAPGTYVMQR